MDLDNTKLILNTHWDRRSNFDKNKLNKVNLIKVIKNTN